MMVQIRRVLFLLWRDKKKKKKITTLKPRHLLAGGFVRLETLLILISPQDNNACLTSVFATLPLCVMFLLCFSLAIRILCLATIFLSHGKIISSLL